MPTQWFQPRVTAGKPAALNVPFDDLMASMAALVAALGGAGAIVTELQTGVIATSVQIMDDWDEADRAKVNPIVGQAGVAAGAGAVDALTQRVEIASDGDGLVNVTPPDPGAAEVITPPAAGAVPAAGDMEAVDLDDVAVTIQGYMSNANGTTAINATVYGRERDNNRIVAIPGGLFTDMEVAGNESFSISVQPQPVGMIYDLIGIQFAWTGVGPPTSTFNMRRRK